MYSTTHMHTTIHHLLLAAALFSTAVCIAAETKTPPPAPAPKVDKADVNGFKKIIAAPEKPAAVKVDIYRGDGAPDVAAEDVKVRVDSIPGATVRMLTAAEVGTVDLKAFDVVVFPGGGARTQSKAIGEKGRNNVREYVRGGGGYVGICAGAYLACSNRDWNLGLLNAGWIGPETNRGFGYLEMELTPEGRGLLGDVQSKFKVRYNNGPVIKPGASTELPAYTTLSLFRTEVSANGSAVGAMVNMPAQAISTFGKGRVFISSPHPESTADLEHMLPRCILWAAGKSNSPTP